jgi:splicing factor 3B subunit 3
VYVCVGAARGMQLLPRKSDGGVIHVFRLHPPEAERPARLELLHSTPTDEPPLALCAFQGRLLAGLGRSLRLYDLGKKKLLRKCENKSMPFLVRTLHAQGERVVVGDLQEGAVFVRYRRQENLLIPFADDFQARHVICSELLDYDTVALADKWGSLALLRLPEETSEDIETDQTGSRFRWEQQWLNGAPTKLQTVSHFHVGEPITALRRATLSPGGQEVLMYSTVHGAIGAFLPFASREDVDFFSHLEMHMRSESPNPVGRDHIAFRSYYAPVRFVYDGDLCELFSQLDAQKQRHVASELDRTTAEVQKKLEDVRNKIL